MSNSQRVVIVGGGFAGLNAARALARGPYEVVLVDRRNHHLFQPLLYQVATGGLSAADIASPLRHALRKHRNVRVLLGELVDIDVERKRVVLDGGELDYDTLIVATGSTSSYFGHDAWAEHAPSLKTIEDATRIRAHVLSAFERAERESDPARRAALTTFAIVGGGATGVELAGALAELARDTLRTEFRAIDTGATRVVLIEHADRLLLAYPPELSARARRSLERLGAEVWTHSAVTDIGEGFVRVKREDGEVRLEAETVLWAAGVRASEIGAVLARRAGAELDKGGRVLVDAYLNLRGRTDVFVVGDLARFEQTAGSPLPGVAPVAMQQGRYVGELVLARARGKTRPPFRYRDRGNMAVIGRSAAVADIRGRRFGGFAAWILWLFIHLMYLVGFANRVLVFVQWAWNYFTRNRTARLITGERVKSRDERA